MVHEKLVLKHVNRFAFPVIRASIERVVGSVLICELSGLILILLVDYDFVISIVTTSKEVVHISRAWITEFILVGVNTHLPLSDLHNALSIRTLVLLSLRPLIKIFIL